MVRDQATPGYRVTGMVDRAVCGGQVTGLRQFTLVPIAAVDTAAATGTATIAAVAGRAFRIGSISCGQL